MDDYTYIPGPRQAPVGTPSEHGVPTSFYAAVQSRCTAHVVDDPAEKADLLNRQVAHFQPQGGTVGAAVGEAPHGRLLSGIRGLRLEVTGAGPRSSTAATSRRTYRSLRRQDWPPAHSRTIRRPTPTHHHRRRTPPTT